MHEETASRLYILAMVEAYRPDTKVYESLDLALLGVIGKYQYIN